ncbi:MAG TPA: NAD(P)-dependent oxidoreductase [Solirubrobacteraceae bacterium]|nr:NAD(P)-dependent oxidoreductase [Solirubrobacteraceae bacterium]
MKVLVTGASGFLGAAVCSALIERGHTVSALARRPGSAPDGVEELKGDLADGEGLRTALAAARPEAVVHLAAEIASQRDESRIREVNVHGTARLVEACGTVDSPKFVFASTVVTGEADGALLTEETELPVDTPYGRSKQEGERLLRESGLPSVVIRPGHVYGPGGWYAHELVRRLRQPGRFAVVGSGRNWWDVVHVDDAAAAFAAAVEDAPPGGLYHLADDDPISLYDFVALTAEALGVGRPRRIPAGLARLVAGRHVVTAAVRSARTSNERIKRELGWAPRFPSARQGVPAAVAGLAAT